MQLHSGAGIQEPLDLMMLMAKVMFVVSVESLLKGVVRHAKCQETIAHWVIPLFYQEYAMLIQLS